MKKLATSMWVITVILSAFLGFSLRYTNEENNKSVLIFSDFDEIISLESSLQKSKTDIMREQKESGIRGVLIDMDNLNQNNEEIKKAEAQPILSLKSDDDIDKFEDIVKQFQIKYIMFEKDGGVIGYPKNLNRVAQIINENNLIFLVYEKENQIGIHNQDGLHELITKTKYSINRLYKPTTRQLEAIDGGELFYKLQRSIIDRSIRFINISQLRNPKYTVNQNYIETNKSVQQVAQFVERMGYNTNTDIVKLNPNKLNDNFYFLVALGLALTITIYVKKLFKLDKKTVACVYIIAAMLCSYADKILGFSIENSLALIASVAYSSLASLMIIKMLNRDDKRILTKGVLTFFGVNILGGYVVVSCLSSLNYTMNLDIFKGVKVSFILPLVTYIANYVIVYKITFKEIREYIISKRITGIILTIVSIVFILAVYILRSGNFNILKASNLELKMREGLEYIMGIRPRTKEFLIGYPMLMLLMYYRNSLNKIGKFVLGAGMAIGGVSIINSFCHVFTDIGVSMTRSANGLILGAAIGAIMIKLTKNQNVRIAFSNNKLVKRLWGLYNNNNKTKM